MVSQNIARFSKPYERVYFEILLCQQPQNVVNFRHWGNKIPLQLPAVEKDGAVDFTQLYDFVGIR